MKLIKQTLIIYFLSFMSIVLIVSISLYMTHSYTDKIKEYTKDTDKSFLKEYLQREKIGSTLFVKQLALLLEYTNNRVVPSLRDDLVKDVNRAYTLAHTIYKKYKNKKSKKEIKKRIKEALQALRDKDSRNSLFVRNYNGETILSTSELSSKKRLLYKDADHRSIVLEEIQKVRKHGEGYIESRQAASSKEEIIFVKDLGLYEWYIGAHSLVDSKRELLKLECLKSIGTIPLLKTHFIEIYEDDKKVYASKISQKASIASSSDTKTDVWYVTKDKKYYYTSSYFAPLNWRVVYGLSINTIETKLKQKEKLFDEMLDREYMIMLQMYIFVILLSLSLFIGIKFLLKKVKKTF